LVKADVSQPTPLAEGAIEMGWRGRRIAAIAAIVGAIALVASVILGTPAAAVGVALGSILMTLIARAEAAWDPAARLGASTMDATDGWSEFHRELARARRFERGFAIIRFETVPGVDAGHVRDRIAATSRRIDRVWIDGGDLFMLLPESDAGGVETAIARVRGRVGEALSRERAALFPANGITSGALVASLYGAQDAPVAIPVGGLTSHRPIHVAFAGGSNDADDEATKR
jgi:hypothetical protein